MFTHRTQGTLFRGCQTFMTGDPHSAQASPVGTILPLWGRGNMVLHSGYPVHPANLLPFLDWMAVMSRPQSGHLPMYLCFWEPSHLGSMQSTSGACPFVTAFILGAPQTSHFSFVGWTSIPLGSGYVLLHSGYCEQPANVSPPRLLISTISPVSHLGHLPSDLCFLRAFRMSSPISFLLRSRTSIMSSSIAWLSSSTSGCSISPLAMRSISISRCEVIFGSVILYSSCSLAWSSSAEITAVPLSVGSTLVPLTNRLSNSFWTASCLVLFVPSPCRSISWISVPWENLGGGCVFFSVECMRTTSAASPSFSSGRRTSWTL